MSGNLQSALLIAAIGMGLVFAAIVLLWGFMALLVRVSEVREPTESAEEPESAATASAADETQMKKRAAAVAVAVALTSLKANPAFFPRGAETVVSPWQAVMRCHQLKLKQQRSRVR
jgi:Na+-transporting methylmalonyl-CoA/oxaloacetate decarboxylase gamma subunit